MVEWRGQYCVVLEDIELVVESPPNRGGSRIISRVLPPAIRFWLSTQLDHVENLEFHIDGRDRDILAGHIPEVFLSAEKAIYQGVHLSAAAVKASAIHINLGQVIRRKPLRLLAPFPVSGSARLTAEDLNISLRSPLLGEGLFDLIQRVAAQQPEVAASLQPVLAELPERTVLTHYDPTAHIKADALTLKLLPKPQTQVPMLAIATQIAIKDGHRLCLKEPHWLQDGNSLPALQDIEIDLGEAVTLTDCEIQPEQMFLSGTVQVQPE